VYKSLLTFLRRWRSWRANPFRPGLLELTDYLERYEVLAALGTFQIFAEKLNFLGTLLQAAARISQKT
jgi:hypothetical protein